MAGNKGDAGAQALGYGVIIIVVLLLVFAYVYLNQGAPHTATTTFITTIPATVPVTTPNTTVVPTPSGITYVPIKIYNNYTSETGTPFQQMILVDSRRYFSFINPNWENVEFTTGPGGTGSVLQAWVESNATNSANATLVWVNLPNGIPAGSTQIYMDFMTRDVMSSSGPTGEAPELNCPNPNDTVGCTTYGSNDNGAEVFNFYDNFAGTSLNVTKWASPYNNANYSIDNGLSVFREPQELYGSPPLIYSKTYNFGVSGGVIDLFGIMNITRLNGDYNNLIGFGIVNKSNDSKDVAIIGLFGSYPGSPGLITFNSSGIFKSKKGILLPNPYPEVYSVYTPPVYFGLSPLAIYATTGYLIYNQISASGPIYLPQSVGFIDQKLGGSFGPVYWIRERAYPPNGVMPIVHFGSVT